MTDIIIVNWNSGEYLEKCIASVFSPSNAPFLNRIIIVDNNSRDDSLSGIRENDKIQVIQNSTNLGFAKACNQGFKKFTADYILLLNPDARLLPDTLGACHAYMDAHSGADILGCSLFNDDNALTHSCSRFASPVRIFFDASGLSKLAPRIFKPATIMTDWDHKESRKVDQLMGAFMFIRKSVFDRIGYFDERFFVYYEEADFSKRLSDAGGVSYYHAGISAIHSGEGTTKNVKAFRLFLNLRSRLLYAKKHFNFSGYLLVWFSTFFIEPVSRFVFLLMKGKFRDIPEMAKGFMLFIIKSKDTN